MRKSVLYGILVGMIASVFSTLIEAFVAFHEELYFLWPWAGFFLYTPGLLTVFITSWLITKFLIKSGISIEEYYGIYVGLSAMITFFIFDNLIVFPIFVAPVVWPWQDFFFNFRFPVGLIDTLANGFLMFLIGIWFEVNFVSSKTQAVRDLFIKALFYLKYLLFILLVLYVILMPAGIILSAQYISANRFYATLLLYVTPIASIILVALWFWSFYSIPKSSLNPSDYSKAYKILLRNTILNGIINEIAFFYEILFLYPFGLERISQMFPTLPGIGLLLIQGYLTVLSFQMIVQILCTSFLMYLKE